MNFGFSTLSALLISFVFGLALVQCGAPKPTLSTRQMSDLLKNAKSAEDHLKLAAHFRAEAEEFEAQARRHEELAVYYRDPSWQIRGAVATAHCERIGMAARDAANEARALEAMHLSLAKQLETVKQ